MAELTVRLVFSLAVVLGLLLLCVRLAGRRFHGRQDAMVRVVHRQPISRNASVSVVNVAGRVLVLGTTDQGIHLLTELDADQVDEASDPAALALVTPIAAGAEASPEWLDAPAVDVLRREQEAQEQQARPGRHLPPRASRPHRGGRRTSDQQGALSGSLLSVQTWRQAFGAVTGRAS